MCRRQSSPQPPGWLRRVASMSLTLRTSGLMGTKGTTGVLGVSSSREPPEQPGSGLAQALAPGIVGQVGHPDQHPPTPQLPEGQVTDNIGEQGSQHVGRPLEFPLTLEGAQLVGLRLVVGRQSAPHVFLPSLLNGGSQLLGEGWYSMMRLA